MHSKASLIAGVQKASLYWRSESKIPCHECWCKIKDLFLRGVITSNASVLLSLDFFFKDSFI